MQTLPPAAGKRPPSGEQPQWHGGEGAHTYLSEAGVTAHLLWAISLPKAWGSGAPKLPEAPQVPAAGHRPPSPRVMPMGSTSHFRRQASPSEPEPHNGLDKDPDHWGHWDLLETQCWTPSTHPSVWISLLWRKLHPWAKPEFRHLGSHPFQPAWGGQWGR